MDPIERILSRIGGPVRFKYPGLEKGRLKDRFVLPRESLSPPYWDVVDLIEFQGEAEQWIRIGYYRKSGDQPRWASRNTITEPTSIWRKLLADAARAKPWVRRLIEEVAQELGQSKD